MGRAFSRHSPSFIGAGSVFGSVFLFGSLPAWHPDPGRPSRDERNKSPPRISTRVKQEILNLNRSVTDGRE